MTRFPLPLAERPATVRWGGEAFVEELRAWIEPVLGAVRLEPFKLRACRR